MAMQTVNFKQELSLLTNLVKELWDGTSECKDLDSFLLETFEAGLNKGRLWIEEYPTYAVGRILNTDGELCPIHERKKAKHQGCGHAYLYDALCIFDQFVSYNMGAIWRMETAYGYWDFSCEADKLSNKLKAKYDLTNLAPKKLTTKEQDEIVKSFKGFSGREAGSYNTAEKLAPRQINYGADSQGIDWIRGLNAAVFSHGLFCAKQTNTAKLVNTLLPIYAENRGKPFNFDNGSELMALADKNEFIKIARVIEAPEFSSTEEFEKAQKQTAEHQKKLAQETPEQKAQRDAEFAKKTQEMIKHLESDEHKAKEKEKNNRLREILTNAKKELPPYLAH